MSDTDAEMHDHMYFVLEAKGRVLVAGLGLGMVAMALAQKEEVSEVVVVELSEDVIKLTKPSLNNKKITVVH